jgi:hypothetical protein
VFVPFLVMSVAASTGHLDLARGFEWIGSPAALVIFGAATVLEVLAFYIPWVDNALDVAAQPLAMAAGVIVTAAVVTNLDPLWKWSLAVIAGGGVAGALQGGTVVARGASTVATAGFGNFLVSTGELVGSVVTSIVAIAWPVVAIVLLLAMLFLFTRWARRFRRARPDLA